MRLMEFLLLPLLVILAPLSGLALAHFVEKYAADSPEAFNHEPELDRNYRKP